ncbi:hypothetical protein WOLCODRAFT_143564 [Wolfiporia cocos MD-104 SS10]|uniref:WD40 repeat-like protein n=1 Tax=Wolfiporia cocos (strain MD-104) TaxID=742152 RepID=A0A2H3JZ68_WOLCO|nr:hypothetical protein WOLCODRAFT_143564 [Wolfiporia cocos MD-104 SS10]
MKLDARVAPDPTRVSDGRILQIHVDPRLPHLVILEVDHMDRQVQVYDTRAAGFKQAPALEFGCRDNNTKFKSRYVKGTTSRSFFARPYADDGKGVVCIWDYRKTKEAMFRLVREAPIVHTALIGSNVVAYGGHLVTIWDTKTS